MIGMLLFRIGRALVVTLSALTIADLLDLSQPHTHPTNPKASGLSGSASVRRHAKWCTLSRIPSFSLGR